METINYIGEHLAFNYIGKFLTLFAFFIAIFSSFAFLSSSKDHDEWDKAGSLGFKLYIGSVVTMVVMLFTMLVQHMFEYQYVYNHSASTLPFYYQFSSFWEGQEGSFMLWTFWQSMIAGVLLKTCQKYRRFILGTYGLILAFLSSFIVGINIGDFTLGSNPFLLFREAMPNMPLFGRADYINFLQEGTGLNPLLQNYWMVIHPPVLFLGYALMSVPFVYTVGYLSGLDSKIWIKSTVRWALLGGGILGVGILMGGAWAYEALSFGGFWAWDPVENASILPWIIVLAGLHTLMAYKHKGYSLRLSVLFNLGAFVMVLYASFLTRSGILGDTSVHSFTGGETFGHLLTYVLFFTGLMVLLVVKNWKKLAGPKEEEKLSSREFWLFVGSIVLLLSWLQIIFFTSLPVINKILAPVQSLINSAGLDWDITHSAITDVVEFYNKYQIYFGIAITLLTGFSLYFNYKETSWKKIFKSTIVSVFCGLALTVFLHTVYDLSIGLFIFSAVSSLAVFTNMMYIIDQLKMRVIKSGAAIAHLGFALLMLGVILSSGKQEAVSINTAGVQFGEGYDAIENRTNILMYKNVPVQMGEYNITYTGDSVVGVDKYFKIYYEQTNEKGEIIDAFYLYPNVQENPKMGAIANPDTRHFLSHDLFTHVTSVYDGNAGDKAEFKQHILKVGDSLFLDKHMILVRSIVREPAHDSIRSTDLAIGLDLQINDLENIHFAQPIFLIRENRMMSIVQELKELGLTFSFDKVDPSTEEISLSIKEYAPVQEFVIMKAIKFPWINIVWLGSILLFIGYMIALMNRLGQKA